MFETDRLIIKQIEEKDFDPLRKIFINSSQYLFIEDEDPLDWFLIMQPFQRARNYSIVLKSSNDVIGCCGINKQLVMHADKNYFWHDLIHYHIDRTLWNQGLATETCSWMKDYYLSDRINKLESYKHKHGETLFIKRQMSNLSFGALIYYQNYASKRVAQKIGMNFIETITHKGRPHDFYEYKHDK